MDQVCFPKHDQARVLFGSIHGFMMGNRKVTNHNIKVLNSTIEIAEHRKNWIIQQYTENAIQTWEHEINSWWENWESWNGALSNFHRIGQAKIDFDSPAAPLTIEKGQNDTSPQCYIQNYVEPWLSTVLDDGNLSW